MKKSLSVLFAFALVFSAFALSASAAGFKDLKQSHRFYDEMRFLEAQGIINGYPDNTFRPDDRVTRGAAAIMIGRTLGLNGKQRATKFPDVGRNQAASGYIASAVEKGIIQGYGDGTYRPNETVTRGQMAIFLSRAFKLKEEASTSFKDVGPNMAAYTHVKRILAENITQGYEDGTYRPNIGISRAQFSAFLARALDDQFKVDLPAETSYMMNTNKVYRYNVDEVGTTVYEYTGQKLNGWNLWDVYEGGQKISAKLAEKENSNGYYMSYVESEGIIDETLLLKYPAKVGQTWTDREGHGQYKIVSVSETVTTPAGTFRNVVKVDGGDNVYIYYAPGVGRIKATIGGATVSELASISNR